jgi:hypothetical protein
MVCVIVPYDNVNDESYQLCRVTSSQDNSYLISEQIYL